jgi:hypothetical protein
MYVCMYVYSCMVMDIYRRMSCTIIRSIHEYTHAYIHTYDTRIYMHTATSHTLLLSDVFMHVCTYACMHIHACMSLCMFVHTYVNVFMHVCAYMRVCDYVHTCMYVFMHVCYVTMHIFMYLGMVICTS